MRGSFFFRAKSLTIYVHFSLPMDILKELSIVNTVIWVLRQETGPALIYILSIDSF